MWMNEWEVRESQEWFTDDTQPNLKRCAEGLLNLMEWTNGRSDGWAYWPVPGKAAEKLMDRLYEARGEQRRGQEQDMSSSQMGAVFRPIRSMLRKQGEEETDKVLFPPAVPERPAPVERWVHLPGDLAGPDLFGIVYEDEEPAIESAEENDGVVWKIKALLIPESAVKVWEKEEDEEEGDDD